MHAQMTICLHVLSIAKRAACMHGYAWGEKHGDLLLTNMQQAHLLINRQVFLTCCKV